jgi:hypothetical protein
MSTFPSFEDFKNCLLNKDVPLPAKPKQESFETFKNIAKQSCFVLWFHPDILCCC